MNCTAKRADSKALQPQEAQVNLKALIWRSKVCAIIAWWALCVLVGPLFDVFLGYR